MDKFHEAFEKFEHVSSQLNDEKFEQSLIEKNKLEGLRKIFSSIKKIKPETKAEHQESLGTPKKKESTGSTHMNIERHGSGSNLIFSELRQSSSENKEKNGGSSSKNLKDFKSNKYEVDIHDTELSPEDEIHVSNKLLLYYLMNRGKFCVL